MLLWPWLILLVFLLVLIVLEVGVLTRRPRVATFTESLLSVFLWIAAAGLTSLGVQRLYESDLWGVRSSLGHALDPGAAWLQFVTAYVTELALSVDNIAVLALIFAHFKVRPALRARMLMWVIIACLLLRAGLIVIGAELLQLPWMTYIFAAALLVAAAREFLLPKPDADVGGKLLIRLSHRLPTSTRDHGQRLVARESSPASGGPSRWVFTPLMMVFLASVAADFSFALDSLPAVFSVTRDPLIAFSSNALAILALRSLYFVIAPLLSPSIGRFRSMQISLTVILLYLAVVTAIRDLAPTPTWVTLVVVTGVLIAGVVASIAYHRLSPRAVALQRPTPLQDVTEAATVARRNLWKIWILIAGTAVIILGIAIAPLPGPGPTVLVPAGLVILATEFVWAQRLLKVFKEKTLQLAEQGDRVGKSFPKWVLIPIILLYYAAFGTALYFAVAPALRLFINCTCLGLSFPFLAWVIRTAGINMGPLNRFIYAKRPRPTTPPPPPQATPAAPSGSAAQP